MKALSIRQPWAWLIVHGPKRIENRGWPTMFRGEFLIHAAKGTTAQEYEDARRFASDLGVTIPEFDALDRGGIVGKATLTSCGIISEDPWFFGPFGFRLDNVQALPFRPLKGQLGFFDVKEAA